MKIQQSNKTNKLISEKFNASLMSDSKWEKLIGGVTDELNEVFIYYKLIHAKGIYDSIFLSSDFKPFFIEPIL